MSTGEEQEFLRLVESVLDGHPVDWESKKFSDAGLRRRLDHLRFLEHLGAANRENPVTAQEQSSPSQSPGTFWGPLVIRAAIGLGKESELYRAFDPALGREVALKLSRRPAGDTEVEPLVLGEARRLARIRHPNVLFVHGVAVHDGRVGMWMDLIRGRTLEACLAESGTADPREAALIGMDLCRALASVHAAGLVHRDVKSSNVMREDGGRILLMDFGIGTDRNAEVWTSAGSPLFMAPELLRGERPTPASDLYALGVVLFRLVTGGYPYSAETLESLERAHTQGELRRLLDLRPDLPPPFVRAVERALAADPGDRYSSAAEMDAALSSALPASSPPIAVPGIQETHEREPKTRKFRRRIGPRTLAAAAFGGLGVAAVWWMPHSPAPLSVDATLLRRDSQMDTPLADGDRIHPGDRLYLRVQCSRDIHLYVLDEDDDGRAFLLFPIAGLDARNPLPGGTPHQVPGAMDGTLRTWKVDTEGGRESLVLVASLDPLPELEAALEMYPAPRIEDSVTSSRPSSLRLRGIGELALEREAPSDLARKRVTDLLEDWETGKAGVTGIWIRRFQLENPAS